MTGLIILAAGESARLGQPKQNLIFQEKTLLQRAVESALASVCEQVLVILGAHDEVIKPTIRQYPVKIIHNTHWEEGMASSIRLGINELQKEPNIISVILILCDQPFVDTTLLDELAKSSSKAEIVACYYNNSLGVPVLFSSKYFEELLQLEGHDGAKKLLIKYADEVLSIPFPMGGVDIDTIEDYEKLKKR
jgi:molybdenum cofactor cytidylyltransferase